MNDALNAKRTCSVCGSVRESQRAAKLHPTTNQCATILARKDDEVKRQEERAARIAARKPFAFTVTAKADSEEYAYTALSEALWGTDDRINDVKIVATPLPAKHHRWKDSDVESALDRYRRLTGDTGAHLTRENRGSAALYRVEGSDDLRFMAYSALAALTVIEMYCKGREDGRRDRQKE